MPRSFSLSSVLYTPHILDLLTLIYNTIVQFKILNCNQIVPFLLQNSSPRVNLVHMYNILQWTTCRGEIFYGAGGCRERWRSTATRYLTATRTRTTGELRAANR